MAPDCEIWKAIRVKDQIIIPENNNADLLVFDTFSQEAYGGTGRTFDWNLCKEYSHHKFGLAGGLGVHNIKQAALLNAFVLDIASGAEAGDCRQKSPEASFTNFRFFARGVI